MAKRVGQSVTGFWPRGVIDRTIVIYYVGRSRGLRVEDVFHQSAGASRRTLPPAHGRRRVGELHRGSALTFHTPGFPSPTDEPGVGVGFDGNLRCQEIRAVIDLGVVGSSVPM